MTSEWKQHKLGNLGFFFGGVTSITKEDYGYGTPFLTYKNVYSNFKVDISQLDLMNISEKDLERRSCRYGDVFFTASSETPDEVAMSSVLLDDVDFLTFNGFTKRYRLNDFNTLLPEFARYLFRGREFRNNVSEVVTGDVRFNISQESLGSITVSLPSIEMQRKIANVLSSLDEKLEISNRINDYLAAA
jgi:type I restriction enzyme S subunit